MAEACKGDFSSESESANAAELTHVRALDWFRINGRL